MTNVINFGGTEETTITEPDYTYELVYVTDPQTGETMTELFQGDAVMTNTFVGFVNGDQILQFAVPLENLVSVRLVSDGNDTVQ